MDGLKLEELKRSTLVRSHSKDLIDFAFSSVLEGLPNNQQIKNEKDGLEEVNNK